MVTRILVALDRSPRAEHVFARAVETAACHGASLIPFHAVSIPPEFPPAGHVHHADALPAYLRQEALQSFEAIRAGVPSWTVDLAPLLLSEVEPPWMAILAAAEEQKVDLVVIGSHRYRGFDRVLGTTAGKVANMSRRDVLVVHGDSVS
jgi:nucleotide-binding universal stress UspA family protein